MKGKLYSKILVNKPGKQVLLTAINEDMKIDSIQINDSITFQVIEGKLKLNTRKESITIDEGQLFSHYDNIKYSLTSEIRTMFLLTIVNEANQQEFA